jgi:glutathione S-transferase
MRAIIGQVTQRRGRGFAYDLHVGEAKLYVIPGSHPSRAAGLMLERKGIPYNRVDMIPGPLKQGWLKLRGFPGDTVPALMLNDEKVQGSREISRALDRQQPEPALFPSDPDKRAAVEDAERWGDEVLQSMPRRISWNSLARDHSAMASYAEGAKLGVPTPIAARTGAPIIAMAKRRNSANDENTRRDLAELPGVLDHVDELISKGVIGGDSPNAADYQIAPSIRLMMTMDDLRPAIENRPAGKMAMRILPEFPGHLPPVLPAEWLDPLRG